MYIANKRLIDGLDLDMKDIIDEEFRSFKSVINSLSEDMPYYVYGLYDGGEPFYIGKGKGNRAYLHLMCRDEKSFKNKLMKYLYTMNEPPVVYLFDYGLTEKEAYELENKLIEQFGRLVSNDGKLINVLPGFIPIHDLNKERNRAGGLALNLTGTRSGFYSKEWREQNEEYVKEYSSKAGKISWENAKQFHLEEHKKWSSEGGKTTGKMKFWTNGKETTRSHECPGPGWYRGNGSINENSLKHLKYPQWTNGEINKLSETKPGDDYFNGRTQKVKNDPTKKNVIVFSKQVCNNAVPAKLKVGKNILDKEETL